ncbi:MAG: lysophospholipid acyltransferase family protein [Nitrospirota bacterium]
MGKRINRDNVNLQGLTPISCIRCCLKTGAFCAVTLLLSPFYFFLLLLFYRWRTTVGPRLVQFYSKMCLVIFRVKIDHVEKHSRIHKVGKGILIISNHTSFLDIFVLSALFGTVFVSKAELKLYPIIGQIAWLMGVIFLDRESSRERIRVLKMIAHTCSSRILAVFPQGTTGRITERLPFSRGIFKVIQLNPELTLVPVTLHYQDDAEIAWHTPQTLREHAVRVCSRKGISVKVIVHNPVTFNDYREKTSSEICALVEKTVMEPLHAGE